MRADMAPVETHRLMQQLLRLTKRLHVKALVLDRVEAAVLKMSPEQRAHLTPAQWDELETEAHESAFQAADKEAAELEHALAHGGDLQKVLHAYLQRHS